MTISHFTVILGAIVAALAYLPYPWAHLTAGAIAVGIAALHGGQVIGNRSSKGQRTP